MSGSRIDPAGLPLEEVASGDMEDFSYSGCVVELQRARFPSGCQGESFGMAPGSFTSRAWGA